MISQAMIEFRSKFQFKILLQFYRTAERVTNIKLLMVMVKILTNTTIFFKPSHFGYYFVFS